MTIEKDVMVRMCDGAGAAPYPHYPAAYNTGGENTVHTGGNMASYLLLPVIPPQRRSVAAGSYDFIPPATTLWGLTIRD